MGLTLTGLTRYQVMYTNGMALVCVSTTIGARASCLCIIFSRRWGRPYTRARDLVRNFNSMTTITGVVHREYIFGGCHQMSSSHIKQRNCRPFNNFGAFLINITRGPYRRLGSRQGTMTFCGTQNIFSILYHITTSICFGRVIIRALHTRLS